MPALTHTNTDVQAVQVVCRKCAGTQIYNLLKILVVCRKCRKRMKNEQNFPSKKYTCFSMFYALYIGYLFIYNIYYLIYLNILNSNNNNSNLLKAVACTLPEHQLVLPEHLFNRIMVNLHRINIQYIKIIKQNGEF